jgi:Family of unknown function (DUF6515)
MKLHIPDRITCFSLLLALGASCPNIVHAGWGSIQGNNHSAPAEHSFSAPRPQPTAPRPEESAPRPEAHPEIRPEPQPVVREQPRVGNNIRPEPVEVNRVRAVQADHRRMDVAAERSQSFYWSDFHAGTRINRLPDGYRRIGVRGHPYFYFGGIFYDSGPSGYVMIAPPLDAEIPDLPPGTETVVLGDTYYYYAGGAFYVQQSDGSYAVVAAPIGVTVSTLPPDATPVTINGITCYQSDGAYFEPVMENGVTAFLTIQSP